MTTLIWCSDQWSLTIGVMMFGYYQQLQKSESLAKRFTRMPSQAVPRQVIASAKCGREHQIAFLEIWWAVEHLKSHTRSLCLTYASSYQLLSDLEVFHRYICKIRDILQIFVKLHLKALSDTLQLHGLVFFGSSHPCSDLWVQVSLTESVTLLKLNWCDSGWWR